MKKSILVTAVSGTGKTTVCKELSEQGYSAIDLEEIDGLYELIDSKSGEMVSDKPDDIGEDLDWNCNKDKLLQVITAGPDGVTYYCGGMANTEKIWDVFDQVIVLTVSDQTTTNRLSTRQPGQFGSQSEHRK